MSSFSLNVCFQGLIDVKEQNVETTFQTKGTMAFVTKMVAITLLIVLEMKTIMAKDPTSRSTLSKKRSL